MAEHSQDAKAFVERANRQSGSVARNVVANIDEVPPGMNSDEHNARCYAPEGTTITSSVAQDTPFDNCLGDHGPDATILTPETSAALHQDVTRDETSPDSGLGDSLPSAGSPHSSPSQSALGKRPDRTPDNVFVPPDGRDDHTTVHRHTACSAQEDTHTVCPTLESHSSPSQFAFGKRADRTQDTHAACPTLESTERSVGSTAEVERRGSSRSRSPPQRHAKRLPDSDSLPGEQADGDSLPGEQADDNSQPGVQADGDSQCGEQAGRLSLELEHFSSVCDPPPEGQQDRPPDAYRDPSPPDTERGPSPPDTAGKSSSAKSSPRSTSSTSFPRPSFGRLMATLKSAYRTPSEQTSREPSPVSEGGHSGQISGTSVSAAARLSSPRGLVHPSSSSSSPAPSNFEREVSMLVAEKVALQEEVERLKRTHRGLGISGLAADPPALSPAQSPSSTASAVPASTPAKWDLFLGASKDVIQSGLVKTRSKVAEVVDTLQKNAFHVGLTYEVMERGAVLRENESLDSPKITHLPHGVLVVIEEINGRRARVKSDTTEGWLSLTSTQGRQLLKYRADINVGKSEGEEARTHIEESFVSVAQEDLVALHKEVQRLTVENNVYKTMSEKASERADNLVEQMKRQEAELCQSFELQTEVLQLKAVLASEKRAAASLSRECERMRLEDIVSSLACVRNRTDVTLAERRRGVNVSTNTNFLLDEKPSTAEKDKVVRILEEKLAQCELSKSDIEVNYVAAQRKHENEMAALRQELKQLVDAKKTDDSNWLYLARIADLERLVEDYRKKAVMHVPTARILTRYLESQGGAVNCFSASGKTARECDLKELVENVMQENLRLVEEQRSMIRELEDT